MNDKTIDRNIKKDLTSNMDQGEWDEEIWEEWCDKVDRDFEMLSNQIEEWQIYDEEEMARRDYKKEEISNQKEKEVCKKQYVEYVKQSCLKMRSILVNLFTK